MNVYELGTTNRNLLPFNLKAEQKLSWLLENETSPFFLWCKPFCFGFSYPGEVECSSRVGLRAFAGSSYVSVTGAVADTVFDA